MRPRPDLLLAVVLLLSGCGDRGLLDPEKFIDPPAREELHHINDAVVGRDGAYIRRIAAPEIVSANFDEGVQAVFDKLPKGTLINLDAVGANKFVRIGAAKVTDYRATYQYHFSEGWAVATIQLRQEDDKMRLVGLNIAPSPDDLAAINAFTFSGKGAKYYAVLAAMALEIVFVLATFVFVLRLRKKLKRPVLWAIVVLVGVGNFSLNWTTGQTAFNWEAAGLFGAAAMSAGHFAPWILTFYLPIGAIAFWALRREKRLKMKDMSEPAEPSAPPPALPGDGA